MTAKTDSRPIFTTPTWPGATFPTRHIRTLRGDNPTLERALRAVEGFSEADDALHAFAEVAAELADEPITSPEDRAAALADSFRAGERLVAGELRERIAADVAATVRTERSTAILTDTGNRLMGHRDEILTQGHDEIAADLTRQFRELIDKARMAGVTTATLDPAAVLRRNAGPEFEALDEATEGYRAIRAALTALHGDYRVSSAQTDALTQDYWTAVTLVDPIGYDRWYPATSGPYQLRNSETGEVVTESLLPEFAQGDPAEIVAWLAENEEAHVWVPSGTQAARAVQALSKARSEAVACATKRIPLRVERNVLGGVVRVRWGAVKSTGWKVLPVTDPSDGREVWMVDRIPEQLVVN